MDLETIVVLEGDQTGQELLEEVAARARPEVIGLEVALPRFDLSLAKRRETAKRRRPRGCGRRSASTGSA